MQPKAIKAECIHAAECNQFGMQSIGNRQLAIGNITIYLATGNIGNRQYRQYLVFKNVGPPKSARAGIRSWCLLVASPWANPLGNPRLDEAVMSHFHDNGNQ